MVPAMLSPPALTGDIPAWTLSDSTALGSTYESGGFMWLGQEAIRSMPSTWVRTRSPASPLTTGRLETPPAPLQVDAGNVSQKAAVSLVAARNGVIDCIQLAGGRRCWF